MNIARCGSKQTKHTHTKWDVGSTVLESWILIGSVVCPVNCCPIKPLPLVPMSASDSQAVGWGLNPFFIRPQ